MARHSTGTWAGTGDLCTCSTCGRVYEYDRRKGHTRKRCNSCGSNRASREERARLKRRMVAYKGGRCELCGYKDRLEALGFHHSAETTKKFSIAGGHGRSWTSIRRELDKCVLLCQNCHAETHDQAVRLGNVRWNRRKVDSPQDTEGPLRTCVSCGRRYEHDFRRGHTRRICNSCRSNAGGRATREALKQRMVEYKGGACQLCGYARCLRALCFHHRDPRSKRFTIASSHLRSWDSLIRELDACALLCHNCHAGAHAR